MKVLRVLAASGVLTLFAFATALADSAVQLPKFSGSLINGVLGVPASEGPFVYVMTQYGFARVSIADPSNPSNPQLIQIGYKNLAGASNGGIIRLNCDCWQGGSTMDVAEAPDGSSRMISDWVAQDQSLNAEVAIGSPSAMAFGQQIDVDVVPLGSRVTAIYLASGKYIGYFPVNSTARPGVAIVDLTAPSGNPSPDHGIPNFSVLPWGTGSPLVLKAASINGKYLLAGGSNKEKKIRIAEIDPATGVPTDTASVATAGTVNSIFIASVAGRTFVFAAEGVNGVRAYEYASGQLLAPQVLPGNYTEVVVRGGNQPLVFAYTPVAFVPPESYVEIWDSNWANHPGAQPRRAARVRHSGAPEVFLGKGFDARVAGNTAYLYRVTPGGDNTGTLRTTAVDISSLTVDPNSPPIAGSTAINRSALLRSGAEATINYFGDRWEIKDASASASTPPANGLSQVSWDWNYTSPFAADTGWVTVPYDANSDIDPAYFPCDPAVGGNIETGSGCWASLGSPTASGTYRYAVQTVNGVGTSPAAPSPTITVTPPKAIIAGLDNTVNPPVLKVLAGQGTADARGSQGNLAEASFHWTFSPGAVSVPGANVSVPLTATAFSLTLTYPDGYTTTTVGNVQQVDLVPEFSPKSGTIFLGSNLTITNNMQKGSAVTLNSAEYSWDDGANYTALDSTFLTAGGTAPVGAPPQGTGYTLTVRYNFTKAGANKSVTVEHGPFDVSSDWIGSMTGPSSGTTGVTVSFTASVQGGSGSPTFAWCWEACSVGGEFTSGSATSSHKYNSPGTFGVYVRITDSGTTKLFSKQIKVSGKVTNPGPLSLSVSVPSSGRPGQTLSFSAMGTGGTPPYSYAWCWEGCSIGGTFTPASGSTTTHSFTNEGSFVITARVTDSLHASLTKSATVVISSAGGNAPLVVNLSSPGTGTVNQPVSFTASASGGTGPYTYAWCWEACSVGGGYANGPATNTHTFSSTGSYTVSVRATDSTSQQQVKSATVTINNGGGGGPFSVDLSGPSSAGLGESVSFTATVTGGSGGFTYAWCWDGCNLGGTFEPGPATNSHTYTTAGNHALSVRVNDSSSAVAGDSTTVSIGEGQTPPNPAYMIGGATLNNGVYEASVGNAITLTAAEQHAASYAWDFGDGTTATGQTASKTYTETGAYTIRLVVTGDGTNTFGTQGSAQNFVVKQPEFSCVPSETALCLNRGRFQVSVAWKANSLGTSGNGTAHALTADTGVFWFFAPTNLELMVKVLDGTQINGYFWVFSGALSSVEYTITVTDTATNTTKTYHNDEPNFGSVADVAAFPGASQTSQGSANAWEIPTGDGRVSPQASTVAAPGACVAGPTTLCLNDNRFKVEVTYEGTPGGTGHTIPLTTDTGAFWFFQSTNLELMIKILDGRSINGHFWVFYGALSDVEYTITVTDTESGATQTYHNPLHALASAADLAAF